MALFGLGFRPFFLAGSLYAALAVPLWIAALFGLIDWQPAGGWLAWHRHEMPFGFAVAIVAGFLLTAVQNWTGIAGLAGRPLALLAGLWLAARLAWLVGAPNWLLIPLDLIFLPAVAIVLGLRLWQVRQVRNYPIVLVLGLLTLCNLISLIGLERSDHGLQRQGALAAIWLIAALIGLIGGRVIPFFTSRGLGLNAQVTAWPWLDHALLLGGLLLALLILSGIGLVAAPWQAVLFLVLAAGHLIRLLRWHHPGIWHVPLLWSLHLAYAWLVLALLVNGFWHLGWRPGFSQGLHLLTIGAMAGMILAMIARVSLGHTGRPLQPPVSMGVAFALLNLAVPLRVWLAPSQPLAGFWLSSLCWTAAFVLFLCHYAPMLWAPRADGKPG
ncbi:NnrS family protein [Pseudomonas jilinensis]|uniref:Short-chain dehydrogenase n=1 Tax=Pseudomonas jilinensis TaxID=2078689 RepID=A0A396RUY4_9PSED|nr:NnrS family protein [Pseudomonas jilinensis]RHW20388.1 short-chain dehydrogenase [Pseudomonas jilinensis]